MSDKTTDPQPGQGAEPKPAELKTLDYYLEHPSEMPTEAAALEQLFGDYEKAHPEAAGGEPKPAEPKAAVASTDKPTGDQPEGQPKIEGVLTKDGKHVIPYAEMERRLNEVNESKEAEAAAKKAAEGYVQQLQGNIEALNAQIESLKAGGAKPEDAPASTELPKELMDTLKAEFPTIAKAVEAQQMLFKHASDKLATLEARIGTAETERAKDVESEVDTLIEQVPELKSWREKTPYLFSRAQQVEEDIFKDQAFMDAHPDLKTDDVARYKEVVKRVKQEVGLPAEAPAPSPQGKTDEQKAEEALAAAQAKAPNSLSDIPAGAPPASSRTESLENLSAAEIGNRFIGMTPDKIQETLARL